MGVRMVRFFKEETLRQGNAIVFGRQVGYAGDGEPEPPGPGTEGRYNDPGGRARYHHTERSMQLLWDEIGKRTGTRWRVSAQVSRHVEEIEGGRDGEGEGRVIIVFVVRG